MARSTTGYLLDTNILVHLIRWQTAGKAIDAQFGLLYSLNRSAISVVTIGEIWSLARGRAWGTSKFAAAKKFFDELIIVNINDPDILAAYGELDNACVRAGQSVGKNDVWIAATAKVTQFTLLTTDADFDFFHPAYLNRIRLDAKTGHPLP